MNIILFDGIPQFISFTDPVGRHIKKVLKAQVGDCLKAGLLDGPRGNLCITAAEAEGYRVEWRESGPPVGLYPLTLLVGFVRPISVKRILREAASLGVERLVFAVTDSGERSYREANLWKTGEYRQYLINGLQTAGATVLPEVVLARGVGEALKDLESGESAGAVPERAAAETVDAPICLVLDNVSEGRPLSKVDLSGCEAPAANGPDGRRVVLAVGSER
ncbi:MAG: 16S rRNA (uracil(1498)-N(3))-methyltransferase, partial [Spirochaetia bacterium]|nr:16S rRNA (uracil(1498)-N(3))-methyltransferase [Spirochaetia bacterium]